MKAVDYAAKFLGMNERDHRGKLMKLFQACGFSCDPLTTAWCAYFVNSCQKMTGRPSTSEPGRARSFIWEKYGNAVDLKNAALGDICVFKRGVYPQGHVNYFIKDNHNGTIQCLGGNQSDRVCYANYDVSSLLGIRRKE